MKNSKQHASHAAAGVARSVGGVARVQESSQQAQPARKAEPRADVLEMFARIHRSNDFTVQNALKDYEKVGVKELA